MSPTPVRSSNFRKSVRAGFYGHHSVNNNQNETPASTNLFPFWNMAFSS